MKKVVLDQSKCIGCGACVAISSAENGGNFDFDENGLSKVVNETPTETTADAAASCPVEAITIEEVAEGTAEGTVVEFPQGNSEDIAT